MWSAQGILEVLKIGSSMQELQEVDRQDSQLTSLLGHFGIPPQASLLAQLTTRKKSEQMDRDVCD